MTTYAIRVEHYADNDLLFQVFTIRADGTRHHFYGGNERDAREVAEDLSRLTPRTVAMLTGDLDAD